MELPGALLVLPFLIQLTGGQDRALPAAPRQDEEVEAGQQDPRIGKPVEASQEFEMAVDAWERIDDRPPMAIWWAETLAEGDWRIAYRYEVQSFDGMRDGHEDLSSKDLEKLGYQELPEEMLWTRHTVELDWGFREFNTLFVSVPFVTKELDGSATSGGDLDQESSGIGDMVVGWIHHCCSTEDGRGRLMMHVGLGLPTGSIDEEDDGPSGAKERLPYPMQPGTGTFDLHPGLYWIQNQESWTWGAGLRWRFPLNRNDEGYGVAGTGTLNLWAQRALVGDLVGSLRLQRYAWGDYHGEDDELDPAVDPLDDEAHQGGERTDLFAGLAWELGGRRKANRLELEVGVPLQEHLDGPQMSTEWTVGLGWRYSF